MTTTPAPFPSGVSSLFGKYAAALLPAAVILLGALQTAIADGTVSDTEGGQLIALVAGVVFTFIVPLVKGSRWAGMLKTGAAVLAAVATLIIPLFTGITPTSLIVFAIAVLNAIATQIGVDMRKDLIDAGTAAPGIPVTVTGMRR